jgi:plasmid stability protein
LHEERAVAQIVIRNIPEDVIEAFKRRASAEGVAAETLARQVITQAARRPNIAESVARMHELRAMTPAPIKDLSSVLREVRDGDDAGR